MKIQNYLLVGLFSILAMKSSPAQTAERSLEQCIELALQSNLNLKATQQNTELAKHKIAEARAMLLPKINATVDYKLYGDLPTQLMPAAIFGGPSDAYKETQFGVPHNMAINIQGSIPLYNRAARSAIETAGYATEMAELQELNSKEKIIWEVSTTYYNAQILASQIYFLEGNIINVDKSIQTMQLLLGQKIATGLDLDKLLLQKAELSNQLLSVKSNYSATINALKFHTGLNQSDSFEVNQVLETKQFESITDRLPIEVEILDKQSLFLESEMKVIRSALYPTAALTGLYGYTGFGKTGESAFFDFYPLNFIGLQANIPIFNGSLTKRRLEQKEAQIVKTSYEKEFIKEKNTLEKENALLQFETARQNLKTNQNNIAFAQQIYERTQLLLKEGLATVNDLLQSDNTVRASQQQFIASLVQLRKAELELKKASGNLRF